MRRYLGYIIGVIGVIVLLISLVLFTYSLYRLITIRDLIQAIDDVSLELAITFSLLILLFAVGWVLHEWSLRQQRPPKQPSNLRLRLRMQRGEYPVDNKTNLWWVNFWQGISTEMYGAVMTGFFLGLVVLVFQQYSAIQNRKAELILQMGSPDNSFAIEAVRQLRAEEWLSDGTLTHANLQSANLTGADLRYAILTGANLRDANLTDAFLEDAVLTGAVLGDAVLTGADLRDANLTGAFLGDFDDFGDFYLTSDFHLTTILPDDTNWTPETDMTRFTDRENPNYWDPCTEATFVLYC